MLRIAVLTEWVFILTSAFTALALEPSLPPELRKFIAEQDASVSDEESVSYVLAALYYLGASIGVYRFWRPARTFYTAGVVAGLAMSFWLGHTVTPSWANPFDYAASVCGGVVLGLLWFSPASTRFQRTQVCPDV